MSVLGMLEQESQWLKIAAWNRLATFAEPKGCATNSYLQLSWLETPAGSASACQCRG